MIIDTHCHIDLYSYPELIVKKLERTNIITIGMTNLPSYFEIGYSHIKNFKKVRLALGLHPLLEKSHTKEEYNKFKRLASKTAYIGEVGLDFSKESKSLIDQQIHTLKYVFENINNKSKVISLHSRKAEKKVLELLKNYKIKNAIFHWYSGNLSILHKIIDEGYYFSINPAMINTQKGRNIITEIPKHLMLTETDGPYVKVENRQVEPKDIIYVLDYLSKLWCCDIKEVEQQIYSNFKLLVNSLNN